LELTWCDLINFTGLKLTQMTSKNITQLKKIKIIFFKKYYDYNILDLLESIRVNLLYFLSRSSDLDNIIENN
jgi:hypothetical protein